MTEATDSKTEDKTDKTSPRPLDSDLLAQVKHFQGLADKRDAETKTLQSKLEKLEKTQEAAHKKELEEKEEFKKLYEEGKVSLEAAEKIKTQLNLQVQLQNHLADKFPDHVADFRWIAPHVNSEEEIASVTEQYVKEHPKTAGKGTAALGNKAAGDTGINVSQADLMDPTKTAALVAEHPDLLQKIEAGEINLI